MKKISILGLACLAVGSMSAQMQVVKDVEHQLKGDVTSYPKAIETLTPAFTNPESANQAQTWYVAGKGAIDFVNNAAAMQRVTGELNAPQAAQFVLDGFDYLQKALPLDSVVDAKGKVKTKYSKDIIKLIVNNYPLTADAGQWFYNDARDYPKAAQAWTLFINLPKDERFAKAGLKAQPDTIVGMYEFYTGCAYSLANDPAPALNSFLEAIKLGYDKKEAYDYAITSATQMKDLAKAAEIAQAAYEVYPENSYLGTIINNYLDKKEYDKASELLDPYIARIPTMARSTSSRASSLTSRARLMRPRPFTRRLSNLTRTTPTRSSSMPTSFARRPMPSTRTKVPMCHRPIMTNSARSALSPSTVRPQATLRKLTRSMRISPTA